MVEGVQQGPVLVGTFFIHTCPESQCALNAHFYAILFHHSNF